MQGATRSAHCGTCLWPTALMVWGPGATVARHAHRCVQVMVSLAGTLRVRERASGRWRRCRAVVVRGDADHEIDASGALVLMGFISAESALGAAVTARQRAAVGIVSNGEAARWRRALGDPKSIDSTRVKRWIASSLLRDVPAAPIHARVDRVMRALRDHPLDTRTTSLAQLSSVAGLSPSRFAHVFTESMGIPVRPYMRWLRLQRAARELILGRTVTQAAHGAGFSDAAHLTRTFRLMLGATPRDLIRRVAEMRTSR